MTNTQSFVNYIFNNAFCSEIIKLWYVFVSIAKLSSYKLRKNFKIFKIFSLVCQVQKHYKKI